MAPQLKTFLAIAHGSMDNRGHRHSYKCHCIPMATTVSKIEQARNSGKKDMDVQIAKYLRRKDCESFKAELFQELIEDIWKV